MTPDDLARRLLRDDAPGAWLLSGAEGVGKADLARAAARLAAPLAADRFLLDAETLDALAQDAPSRIEAFRRWLRGPVQSATMGTGVRVAVIADVDRLPGPGQTAEHFLSPLLKALEEPPERLRFVLTAARPGRLPATLRSRCVRLSIPAPGPAEAAAMLGGDALEAITLLRLAGGSPGLARRLRADGIGAIYDRLLHLVRGPAPFSRRTLVQIADGLLAGATGQEARLRRIEDLALCVGHLLRGAAHQIAGDPLPGGGWTEEPLALRAYALRARPGRLAQASAFFERIRSDTRRLALEPRHAALRLLLCLEHGVLPSKP
jgi:DNA polymerase-3 subunit delta'